MQVNTAKLNWTQQGTNQIGEIIACKNRSQFHSYITPQNLEELNNKIGKESIKRLDFAKKVVRGMELISGKLKNLENSEQFQKNSLSKLENSVNRLEAELGNDRLKKLEVQGKKLEAALKHEKKKHDSTKDSLKNLSAMLLKLEQQFRSFQQQNEVILKELQAKLASQAEAISQLNRRSGELKDKRT